MITSTRTSRAVVVGATTALVWVGTWPVAGSTGSTDSSETVAAARPNIVYVMTDDLSSDLVTSMDEVQDMIDNGISFTNFITSSTLCCPSRATFLTGKYPHNTRVKANFWPDGGFGRYYNRDLHDSIGGYLQSAGYRTGLLGKYLNEYATEGHVDGPGGQPDYPRAFVPPGWDRVWITDDGYQHFQYAVTSGTPGESQVLAYRGRHEESNYFTDRLAGQAVDFIRDPSSDPFFLVVSSFAPYSTRPGYDVERSSFPGAPRDRPADDRRPPAWGEPEFAAGDCGGEAGGTGDCEDVAWPTVPADVYNHIVTNPTRWAPTEVLPDREVEQLRRRHLERVRMVQAVDDLLTDVDAALVERGVAEETYVIFGSDNGFHMGEHALTQGKATAYDHDVRLPFVVVPPGGVEGREVGALASNVDLLPTFAEIAGVSAFTEPVDGASLLPFVRGGAPDVDWRTTAYVEKLAAADQRRGPDRPSRRELGIPPFGALRSATYLYVDYSPLDDKPPGRRAAEYFDLRSDPYQMKNLYRELAPDRKTQLNAARQAYASCRGESCLVAGRLEP